MGVVSEPDGVGVVLFDGFTVCGCWLSMYNGATIKIIIAVIAIPK